MRKIALFKGLRDSRIQGFASSAADIKKHVEACENKKLVQYHREGKSWPKAKMGGLILNRHIDGAEMVRKDCNFHPTQVGDHFMFDWDCNVTPFTPQPEDLAKRFVETLDEQVPGFAECCVFEKSCSGALHGAVPCFSGNPKQDLAIYEKVMGVEADRCTLNPSRCFIVTHDLLQGSYDCLFREVPSSVIEGLRKLSHGEEAIAEPQVVVEKESPTVGGCDLQIYGELLAGVIRQNGVPQKGERNSTMWRIAVDLIAIGCNQLDDLLELFRAYSFFSLSEQEARSCISSALRHEEPTRSEAMRTAVCAVLDELPVAFALSNEMSVHGRKSEHTDTPPEPVCDATTESESASEGAVDAFGDFSPWQKHAPEMPSKLPPFVRTLIKPIKRKSLWPHCLGMSEPTLATLLQGTTFTDLVGDTHSLYCGWMACGIAASSSGKSSAWKPIDALCRASGLYEEDALARQELDEWRKSERKRSTSTSGADRPRNYSRILGSSSTQAAIIQRHADLEEGRSLLMNCSEISALDDAAGGSGKKFWLMNFDNDWFRQERSSSASDSFAVRLSMNISTCCPPSVAQEWFKGEWLTGQITRWNLTTIISDPDEDDSDELYGNLTGYEDTLKVYLSRLDEVAGKHLEVRAIRDLVKRLRDEMLDYAAATGSTALKVLVRRASLRFQKCALLYYTLEGSRMSPQLTEFLVWRWRYMIWSTFFTLGDLIEREQAKDDAAISGRQKQNGPINLLIYLPEVFDMSQLRALRVERKFADNSDTALKNQLRTWKNRKLVSEIADKPGVWRKCKK